MTLLPKLPNRTSRREQRQTDVYRGVMRRHAKMGGKLFGPIPTGHRREFFCLDASTWVWHEEWTDNRGKQHALTTRYDVRPDGVLKSQGSRSYQMVTGDELQNLYQAALLYRDNLHTELGHAKQQV